MPTAAHKVVVIGHRNPDTDSICSAIAYAELKNKTTDLVCEPRRAGKMNQETEFVLKKFGVTPPRLHQPAQGVGDHARPADRHPAHHQRRQ